MEQSKAIILFQEKQVRRVWHEEKWYFSVVDVIEILTDSPNPRVYWGVLKKREIQLFTNCKQLKLTSTDGKKYATDCANTEGLLRIIMSIPSPKAEPFKLWLAQVGEERIQEIENPELGIERIRELYKAKGYTDEWIASRLKSIDIRKELTKEWQQRGVKDGQEYAILTAEIAKATFGLTPSEHKGLKQLDSQNLRDHMTNLELIFSMLGEEATRSVTIKDNAQGFSENQDAAQRGGKMAGNARRSFEETENVKVVSAENFLNRVNNTDDELKHLE